MKKNFRIIKFKKDKPILEVRNLSKNFDGRPILKKLSLKVYPGEVVGLLGPNGAGKSTLFNIVIGAENLDSGEILINNKSIVQIPIHLRSKEGLGYLPQTRSLFNGLSVYNNLYGLIQIFEKNPSKQVEECERLLDEWNLNHLRTLKAEFLSGGEAKRLQLARLMINNPKVVLLDEIFSQVDPIQVQEMQKHIMKIQSMKVSCIIADHGVANLLSSTDRNYVMSDGSIIAEGASRELLKNREAIKNYFGSDFTFK